MLLKDMACFLSAIVNRQASTTTNTRLNRRTVYEIPALFHLMCLIFKENDITKEFSLHIQISILSMTLNEPFAGRNLVAH